MHYKQAGNETYRLMRQAKSNFFMQSARQGLKGFWRNIETCTDLGRIKSHFIPWPCTSQILAKASANKINNYFTDSDNDTVQSFKTSALTSNDALTQAPTLIFSFKNISTANVSNIPSRALKYRPVLGTMGYGHKCRRYCNGER